MGYNFGPSPTVKYLNIAKFRGVDFASSPTQMDKSRSPDAQNIISDLAGKPVKRTGYETVADFGSRINGIYRLATEDVEKFLVHAGTKLYEWVRTNGAFASSGSLIYSDMNNARSTAFQNDKKLYILDGKTYLVYGEFDGAFGVKKVTDVATVPLCIAGQNPDGSGGRVIDDINVLTTKRTYSFHGTETGTAYRLAVDDMKIDSTEVKARVLNASGDWVEKKETTDFTVNRTTGVITFKTAPGKSPATGVPNVEITFSAATDYTADLINKCTIAIQYGVNGATDRVFVSGNGEAKNFHYWSGVNDPCYFPGENYAYLGQDSSAIMGYSLINDMLAVHKEDNEQDQTIFLVTGATNASTGKTQFAISGSIAGVGAISKYCFQRLDTEPLFLARQGVYALTTQYLTAERYAQGRSWYVDPRLTREADLSEAVATEYNNYYYLAVNNHLYVVDGKQKNYEKNTPQSTFQYEWYYLTNIDARVWWEYNGRLYFGDQDGKVKLFMLDSENTAAHNAYNDDGAPIRAYWYTPIFSFETISRYKTLKGFWLMLSPYRRSSVEIYYRYKSNLQLVKRETTDIFDFNDIDLSRLSFTTDDFPMIIATNAKAKKFMLIQFCIENNVAGEGFGFYEMEASFIVAGKYKG